MPKFPNFSNRVAQITGSVFEKFAAKMAAQGENLIKLHIGDTYLPPKFDLPIKASTLEMHRDFNQYCDHVWGEIFTREISGQIKRGQ